MGGFGKKAPSPYVRQRSQCSGATQTEKKLFSKKKKTVHPHQLQYQTGVSRVEMGYQEKDVEDEKKTLSRFGQDPLEKNMPRNKTQNM